MAQADQRGVIRPSAAAGREPAETWRRRSISRRCRRSSVREYSTDDAVPTSTETGTTCRRSASCRSAAYSQIITFFTNFWLFFSLVYYARLFCLICCILCYHVMFGEIKLYILQLFNAILRATAMPYGWLRGTAVDRWSLTDNLSLFCMWPTADGWPLTWVNRPL